MNLPRHFLRYFLLSALLLFTGIALAILQSAILQPGVIPQDSVALHARAAYHSSTVMPFMESVFFKLLFLNAGVALCILLVPLFWVWIWWFRRDAAGPVIAGMQGTAALLTVALGHNSFLKLFTTFRQLPLPVTAAMYLPHGIPEMLAFILAGTTAFLVTGCGGSWMEENRSNRALHPGDVCLFILGRVWKAGLVIVLLMTAAAAIECRVTPGLVESAYAAALG